MFVLIPPSFHLTNTFSLFSTKVKGGSAGDGLALLDGLDLLQKRPDGLQILCYEQGRIGLSQDPGGTLSVGR